MSPATFHTAPTVEELERHFRRHVRLYDATRWAALHGRMRLARALRPERGKAVLEIGCGTGAVLRRLARAVGPTGRAVGVDLCAAMLRRARRRCRALPQVELRREVFGPATRTREAFDAVVLSYCLSMTPAPEAVLRTALDLLRPGGRIGVVDFLEPNGPAGRWLLSRYPVRSGGSCRALLRDWTDGELDRRLRSWTGLWSAYLWIGRPARPQNTCM